MVWLATIGNSVKKFSGIAEPLTNLLKKSTKFKWNDKCQDAFYRLKAILKSAPVLLAPDFDKCFKLAVDASDVGIAAVLLQEDNNGIDHPVCYFSKKFNKHQKNYSTIECLALILAIQQFEVYLTSSTSPIVVFSDHNPLSFLHKLKNKNQRLLRWSLLLQEFNLDIRHIKGKITLYQMVFQEFEIPIVIFPKSSSNWIFKLYFHYFYYFH